MIKRFFTVTAWMLIAATAGMACTNMIVGKKASADGSVLVSYNADDYGKYGYLCHFPAGKHAPGTMRDIYEWDTNKYLGKIPEAPETYNVVGNMNEYQVSIGETTFGGRPELQDSTGIMDYGSLIYVALQRSRSAREAIKVMTSLVKKYGYYSSGETFTIADPNEAWIMEMIGKGVGNKGAVWVAIRIPDDCICAHANQSRIHKFDMADKKNVLYSPDVISFAREKGYFKGVNKDFDFAAAYCPLNFEGLRFCEARAWSFLRKFNKGMDKYLDYAEGKNPSNLMPLYVKPDRKLSVQDIENANRDHYEGTPLDMTVDCTAGPYASPYRPTPLTYKVDGKEYFNERPISTQQTAFTFVAQMRENLPNAIGGVLWFGTDDPNMTVYTPVYCCTDSIPECYDVKTGDDVTFSWKSSFWIYNWVANMVYPRYSQMFGDVKAVRDSLENSFFAHQAEFEKKALELYQTNPAEVKKYLTDYSITSATKTVERWKGLGEYLVARYNELNQQAVGKNGQLEWHGTSKGYTDAYKKLMIEKTGDRYAVPVEKEATEPH